MFCDVRKQRHSSGFCTRCKGASASIAPPNRPHALNEKMPRGQACVRPGLARRALRTASIPSAQCNPPPRFRVSPSLPHRTPTGQRRLPRLGEDPSRTPPLATASLTPTLVRQTSTTTVPMSTHSTLETPSCRPVRPFRPLPGTRFESCSCQASPPGAPAGLPAGSSTAIRAGARLA